MPLPPWALFVIAAWLILFGSFRIAVFFRARRRGEDDAQARGAFSLGVRRHLVFGLFYIVAGAYLVIIGFGYGAPSAMSATDDVPLPPPPAADHVPVDR